ncbi:MAG: carboxylesterase family protein [Desulfatiglans sp.]|nr:carboxylesterase family protein [Desulfatiglans sp.]
MSENFSSRNFALSTGLLLFILLFTTWHGVNGEAVKTEYGAVQGTIEDGIRVYRGIPYALPPVGDLRWRAPQPAQRWSGVLPAKEFGHASTQNNPALANLAPPNEDCLYLNVWTPAKNDKDKLAVMVWIHGGGFTAGATAEQLYHGEHLAKRGIVVVTVGYRLGVFGFLAHPGLSSENNQHVSGNYGLLDMIAGLKWVQNNISVFGGDPGKVTIFGESAGGARVSILCASPLAKGLFHGAIAQSGGFFASVRSGVFGGPGEGVNPLAYAEKTGETFTASAGASTIAELRQIQADKLESLSLNQPGVRGPVCDRWVIPDDLYKLYQTGNYNHTPIIVGYNSDEGANFGLPGTPEAYIKSVQRRYGPFAEKILELYPSGNDTAAKMARYLMRDVSFGWPDWTWARLQAKTSKSKVFFYYFDHHPDYPPDSPRAGFGAAHSDEMPLVFHQFGLPGRPEKNDADLAMSETIMSFWTNFAKYEDPNGEGLPDWPVFEEAKQNVMHFAKRVEAGPIVNEKGIKVIDNYFNWLRSENSQTHDTTGPYKVLMEMDPSLPGHTIFRPENLSEVKGKLPVVAVAHGGCYDVGNFSSSYTYEIASYGFLVIANGEISKELEEATEQAIAANKQAANQSGEAPSVDLATKVPQEQLTRCRTDKLFNSIDWAIEQNKKPGSLYNDRLDTGEIAVMGASCGALQALDASLDSRIKTVVFMNSGIMRTGIPEGEEVKKIMDFLKLPGPDLLKKLRTPVIYLNGGPTDIAYDNSEKDFEEIENVFVFKGDLYVGHGGTFFEPHGGKFAEAATQWLLWQLKGDKKAGEMFLGDKCGICMDPDWKVKRKNIP